MQGDVKAPRKIAWISKAKGFGILGVLATHTAQVFPVSRGGGVLLAGMYCVQLFFVLSAYLAFKSLDSNRYGGGYFQYIAHKLVRLIPVLYTAGLGALLWHCVRIGKIPGLHDTIWQALFFSLSFLNGFSYRFINFNANWYVGDLVIFLAIAPMLRRLLGTARRAVAFFIVSVLVCWLSTWLFYALGFPPGEFFYYWLPRQLPLLALGIAFYTFERDGFRQERKACFVCLCFISFGFLLSKCYMDILEIHVQYGILLFLFCYTLFNTVSGKCFRCLEILGDNSYAIYLYHVCLLPAVANIVRSLRLRNAYFDFLCCYAILLLFSFLLARLVNRMLERPFFAYMRVRFGV